MMNQIIQPVVIAIIERDGKYLFTQRADVDLKDRGLSETSKGIWQTPGGTLEFGEDCEDCLKREILEETGIEIEIVTLLPKLYTDVRNLTWHGLLINYLCRMKNVNDQIKINEEASDYKWLTYEEAEEFEFFPYTMEALDMAENFLKKS